MQEIKNGIDRTHLKYILPYRINNEPLIEWKDSAYYYLYNFDKGDQLTDSCYG